MHIQNHTVLEDNVFQCIIYYNIILILPANIDASILAATALARIYFLAGRMRMMLYLLFAFFACVKTNIVRMLLSLGAF